MIGQKKLLFGEFQTICITCAL